VDVHTAHADVSAELAAVRETATAEATELRALEIERLDGMTSGLWPKVRAGSPPAVSAAVRVSERRSRLLGLDAPVATRSELTGSLSVYGERLAAERELFSTLTIEQREELARENQALVDKMTAMARANAATRDPSTSPRARLKSQPPAEPVADVVTDGSADRSVGYSDDSG
jgi:hypothetical protein